MDLGTEMQDERAEMRSIAWRELKRLGFPLDAIETLGQLKKTPPVEAALQFLADPKARFLLLLGRSGTGKTAAATLAAEAGVLDWAATRNSLPSGYGISHSSGTEFILASTFARLSGYAVEDKEWFERLCKIRMLVLDDFGAEHLSSIGMGLLDEMLTRRHAARLRTAITTNLNVPTLKTRLGERLYGRINEFCVTCVSIGESLRRRSGAA